MLKFNKKNLRMKGTVTYLSDIITAVTTMFTTMFMLFVSAIVIFLLHVNMTGSVYGDVYYDTPAVGSQLTAILDYNYQGMEFKDILPYFAFYGSDKIKINSKTYDAKIAAAEIIKNFKITEHKATLSLGSQKIILSKGGVKPEKFLRCATYIIPEKQGELVFCSSREGA